MHINLRVESFLDKCSMPMLGMVGFKALLTGDGLLEKVILGRTGICISKLGFGTGTNGLYGTSEQTKLGSAKLINTLRYACQNGISYWDTADAYGSHSSIANALKDINRSEIVISTKTDARTPVKVAADIDRFLAEMEVGYIDFFLLHYIIEEDWLDIYRPLFETLKQAKKSSKVKAIGISCHSQKVLSGVLDADWLDVVMVRLNHAGIRMDTSPSQVIELLNKIHQQEKGIIAIKVLGNGQLTADPEKAIEYIYNLNCVDAMIIGMTKQGEIDQNVAIIEKLSGKSPQTGAL